MLNPVPIQFLALFAYFTLRITVCAVLFVVARSQLRSLQTTTKPSLVRTALTAEALITGAFLVGIYTQYAALLLLGLSLYALYSNRKQPHILHIPNTTAVLLLGISLSLFITGAGVFAVDLPI